MAVCGIPAFLVTIALAFLPESPKYLISKGKEVEALKVIFLPYRYADYSVCMYVRCNFFMFLASVKHK